MDQSLNGGHICCQSDGIEVVSNFVAIAITGSSTNVLLGIGLSYPGPLLAFYNHTAMGMRV